MEFFRKYFFIILTPSLFLGLILIFNLSSSNRGLSGPTSVIDGDTLEVDGKRYRLSGIDAPESKQSCQHHKLGEWPCGRKATDALRGKIGGKDVRCTGSQTDRYKRILGTCYLGKENLNEWMVRNGWALAYTRYSNEYVSAERKAKKEKLGIWDTEFINPEQWRRQN